MAAALAVGLWSAHASADVDPATGFIRIENSGTLQVQMMYSGAGFRDVLVLNNKTVPTPLLNCGKNETFGSGQAISNCVYDIGFCQGTVIGYPTACDPVIENGGPVPSCNCRTAETLTIGQVTGSVDQLEFWLYVDNPSFTNANGDTVDYIWKPSGTSNPDPDNPTKPHLRTTQLSADSYLIEWEDLPAAVTDADQNDLVALVQVIPNNCQQSASNPAFCNTVTFYPNDPVLKNVRTATRAIIEDLTAPNSATRQIGLTTKVWNFNPTAVSLAVCPMLTIPASGGTNETSTEYGYLNSDGVTPNPKPQCGIFSTDLGDPVISFGSFFHDVGSPTTTCVTENDATNDVLPVPAVSGSPQSPGEKDFFWHMPMLTVDNGLLANNKIDNKDRTTLSGLIFNNNNPAVTKNVFYNTDPSFSCVTGTNTRLSTAAAAIPAAVGTMATATTYPFAINVNSPATVRIPTTPPGLESPTATPINATMDFLWSDNIPDLDPTRSHFFGILEAELPPQNVFLAGGTGVHSELVTMNFPDNTPEGFQGTLQAILRNHDTGATVLITTVTFAKDHTAPTVDALSTVRTQTGVTVNARATDPAAGIGQGDLLASINGSSQPKQAMAFGAGDFFHAQDLVGTILATPAEVVSVDFTVDDTHFDAVTVSNVPVADSGGDRFAECDAPSGATVTLDGSKSTGPSLGYLWSGPFGAASGVTVVESLPFGANAVSLNVTDSRGYTGTESSVIVVGDTTGPTFTCVSTSPNCVWPPNHKSVTFTLGQNLRVNVTDTCDPHPTVQVTHVSDSDGNNIVVTDGSFNLAADKGVVYHVTLEARDASGNITTKVIDITVPHDNTAVCNDPPACP